MTRQQIGVAGGGSGACGATWLSGGAGRRWQFEWQPMTVGEADAMVAGAAGDAGSVSADRRGASRTFGELRRRALREKRRGGLDLVVVDYIGMPKVPESKFDARTPGDHAAVGGGGAGAGPSTCR